MFRRAECSKLKLSQMLRSNQSNWDTDECWPMWPFRLFFLLFLNKHQKDSQPYFRPLQPTHKGSKWLISAWQCAASPHIRRPESGFPWCGWCHGAARCWRASGLSEEMLRRQNRQKVNGKHMLRNQRIYAFISCIIRIQHRPSLSLTTYIQGIKKRLKQRKKIQGGFTAVSSHTRLSKHLWCKRH